MVRSRLKKRLQRQVIKNLFLSVIGIIVILFVLVNYGIPLLVNFSLFLSGIGSNQESQITQDSPFVITPILNAQYSATNSAKAKINGTSSPNLTVLLYNNGNLADKVLVDKNGEFSSVITLNPDDNIVKAKTISSDGKESVFSESITIVYINSSPTLEIFSPLDDQTFSQDHNTTEIKGKTDSNVRVTINGFWATIDNDNNFSYNLTLKEGLNDINITATDQAGNKTEKKISVTYYP
jgi:hypothetical protein